MLNINLVGNCQLFPLYRFLKAQDFVSINYLPVHSSTEEEVNDLHKQLQNCDILINTLTDEKYRNNIGLGSEYLRSLLNKKNSLDIVIPCIYYSGQFPTTSSFNNLDTMTFNYDTNKYQKSKYHDYIPMLLAKNGILDIQYSDIEHALYPYKQELVDLINLNHNKSIHNLKMKELKCNISVSDIILEIYKNGRCFYSNNHPTNEILLKVYAKIIQSIDSKFSLGDAFKELFEKYKFDSLNPHDKVYIYKFVDNILGEKDDTNFTNNNILSTIVKYCISSNYIPEDDNKNPALKNSKKILTLAKVL